jgi:hypothetical protein
MQRQPRAPKVEAIEFQIALNNFGAIAPFGNLSSFKYMINISSINNNVYHEVLAGHWCFAIPGITRDKRVH